VKSAVLEPRRSVLNIRVCACQCFRRIYTWRTEAEN